MCVLYRYIPNARTQYEYPGDYEASDAQSCSADSNLLLHPEESKPYSDPYDDPYEDSPESSHGRCPAEEEAQAHTQSPDLSSSDTGSLEDGGKESDGGAVTAEPRQEEEDGSRDEMPEQSLGTDVKR